jgi:hypothetical protein
VTTITVSRMAALRLDDPALSTWLARYAIDYSTYYTLMPTIQTASGAAASFREGRIIIWQQVAHERYAVVGRAEMGDCFYAIPRDTVIPRGTERA